MTNIALLGDIYSSNNINKEMSVEVKNITPRQVVRNLDKIRIAHTIQPIICANSSYAYGFEAFSQLFINNFKLQIGIEDVLTSNLSDDELLSLDRKLMRSALKIQSAKIKGYRFINISSEAHFVSLDPDEILSQSSQVVLELTEHFPISNWDQVWHQVEVMKSKGIRIAIDDFGSGHGNYQMLFELSPHYVKLDKFFIKHAIPERASRNIDMLKSLVDTIHHAGAKVICEGVETEEHLDFFLSADVDYCQGYYFGKPVAVG